MLQSPEVCKDGSMVQSKYKTRTFAPSLLHDSIHAFPAATLSTTTNRCRSTAAAARPNSFCKLASCFFFASLFIASHNLRFSWALLSLKTSSVMSPSWTAGTAGSSLRSCSLVASASFLFASSSFLCCSTVSWWASESFCCTTVRIGANNSEIRRCICVGCESNAAGSKLTSLAISKSCSPVHSAVRNAFTASVHSSSPWKCFSTIA